MPKHAFADRATQEGFDPANAVMFASGQTLESWKQAVDVILAGLSASAPVNTVAPAAPSGSLTVGGTLTFAQGTWTGASSYAYQARRNGVAIPGATGTTYVTQSADIGAYITCTVTATATNGLSTAVQSSASGPIVIGGSGLEPGHNYLATISAAKWSLIGARRVTYGPTATYAAQDPEALVAAIPTSGGTTLSVSGGNDSAAINTALGSNSLVFLNAGTYVCPDAITIPANKKLIGVAGAQVTLDHTTNFGSTGLDGYGVHMMNGTQMVNVTVYRAGGFGIWVDETARNFLLYKVSVQRTGDNPSQPTNRRYGTGFYIANGAHTGVLVSCEALQGYDTTAAGGNADGFRLGTAGGGNILAIDCHSYENSDDGFDCWGAVARNWIFYCFSKRNAKNPLTANSGDGTGYKLGGTGDNIAHYMYGCTSDDNKYFGVSWNANAAVQIVESCVFANDDAGQFAYNGTADSHYTVI